MDRPMFLTRKRWQNKYDVWFDTTMFSLSLVFFIEWYNNFFSGTVISFLK